MIDMVRLATQACFGPAISPVRRPKPDYVCGSCGSTDLDKGDIRVCQHCGKQAEFTTKVRGGTDEFGHYEEHEETTCHRCGFKSEFDDAVLPEPMAWYCRECGHVGEPRDLDRERLELAEGL